MVGDVKSIPTEDNLSFCWNLLKPLDVKKCQICVENENLERDTVG